MADTKIEVFDPGNRANPYQRRIKLSPEKEKIICADLKQLYDQHKAGTGPLRSMIQQWVNDSEGIAEPGDGPWDDASSIVKPIIETRQNIVHSFWMNIIRPMMGRIFVCVTENDSAKEDKATAKDMAAFFNTSWQFNRMFVQMANEAFWAVLRDGTVPILVDWLQKLEKKWEVVNLKTVDEFQQLTTKYQLQISPETISTVIQKLSAGEPVALDIDRLVTTENRPDIDMFELKDLVVYPLNVSRQERTRFIGVRFWRRASEMMAMAKQKTYDEAKVKEVIAETPEDRDDPVANQQQAIEGTSDADPVSLGKMNYEWEHIHGRYLADIDDDGIEEKILVTYCPQANKLVQFDKYPFWHNEDFIQLAWFKRRPKRLFGRGVAQMLSDLQLEASIQARFRIDSRAITNAPVVLANETLKEKLDPTRKSNRIRPGTYLWVPESKMKSALAPVEFPKRDFGESQQEEAILQQTSDNLLGASELRSGRETPNDPRAPAAKTAMLLQQSSVRLDDFVSDFIFTLNTVLDIAKKLYYQYGPETIKFSKEENGQTVAVDIDRSKFNNDKIHLQLAITSLMDNPDFLRQKWEEFYQKFGPEPMLGAVPAVRWEILNQILLNTPEANGINLLAPLDKIQAMLQAQAPAGGAAPGPAGGPANPTLKSAMGGGTQ